MRSGGIELLNIDCMEYMSTVPDKFFDLAIVDPPYGIGADTHEGKAENGWTQWNSSGWDNSVPKAEYFKELFRVSKEQIVWGGNYFLDLWQSPCKGFIIWDKGQRDFSLADVEFAWTSFDRAARAFDLSRAEAKFENDKTGGRVHPTQKPVSLYKWILTKYAKEGMKIFDSHLGSGSIALACHDYKFELTACEIDKDYFDSACKRFQQHISQTKLF